MDNNDAPAEIDAGEIRTFERESITCEPVRWRKVAEEAEEAEEAIAEEAVPEHPVPFVRDVTLEKEDAFGNLRCMDYRPHHVYKGKVVLMSETDAWRVTRKVTAKEQRNGTYNPAYPLGPYACPAHNHYHIGHDPANVGRRPSRMIRFRLWIYYRLCLMIGVKP